MKKKELLVLTQEEAIQKRDEMLVQYRKLRFQQVVGFLENPLQLRTTRRNLARLHTRIHQLKKLEGGV